MDAADVVVIGAGPAGSATACRLARAGVNVVLLDRSEFPRDKVCGDGLAPATLAQLSGLGLLDVECRAHRILRARVVAPDGGSVETPATPPGAVLARRDLDRMLLDLAVCSGARFHPRQECVSWQARPDGILVESRQGGRFTARCAVLATGCHGRPLRAALGAAQTPRPSAFGLRAYFEGVDCPEDTIILDYHPALVPAYAWVFPMGHGRANVGVWFLAGRRAGQGNALHEWLTHSPTARKMLGRACQLSPIRGAPLAVGSWTGRWGVERMLLVGDALGGANPLSGEGLYEALLTARIASDVLCDRLRSGDLSREALTGYQAAVRQAVALPHRLSRWLSVLLRLPGCLNRVVAGARRQGRVAVAVLRAALPQPLSGRIMEAGENWEGRA